MKELEHLFTAVRDLGGGVKSTDGITPLQVARAHQWVSQIHRESDSLKPHYYLY